MEIQRLIGRSLRAVIDFHRLGERSVTVDCDVIQADGGTRCASITGAFIAMHDAMEWLVSHDRIAVNPIKDAVAAVSVGIHKGESILDLDYREDSSADVDMNIVMTGAGKYVEIQGTAEEEPFDHSQMQQLLEVGHGGLKQIFDIQKQIIAAGRK
jgi:ribonuclease PH